MANLFSKKEMKRGAKYGAVGGGTFLLDFIILITLVELFDFKEFVAAPIGFFVGVSTNYFISRTFVFTETHRGVAQGYVFFLSFAAIGIITITGLMYLAVEQFEFNYLISRIVIAGFVGLGNYLANYFINFKIQKEI